jgi:hypothetical protein
VVFTAIVTANVVPSIVMLSTLMVEAIRSSETSILARATRRHISEDGGFHFLTFLANQLTALSKILPKNLMVTQLVTKFSAILKHEFHSCVR